MPVNVSNGEYQMPPEQVHAVGVQALNQMRDATHTPAPAGFKPQNDGLYFFGGGSPAEEDRRRQAMQGGPFGVSYSGMTGQPQPIANPLPQPRSQPAAGMRSVSYGDLQRAPNIPQPSMPAPTRRIDSVPAPQPSAQGTPRAEQAPQQPAQQEAATTQEQQPSPTTFSSLQREPNIPRTGQPRQMPQGEPIGTSGVIGGFQAAGQRAAAGVQSAADQVAQAGRDFVAGGQAMTDQAATASGALNYLNRGDPVRDAASAVGGFFARSSDQARLADYGNTGAPSPIAAKPPAAQPSPAAVGATEPPAASDAAESDSPATAPPDRQATPLEGYTYQPDPNQGPAPGMSVRPTSAEGISRIDNAPGLKSPLFTNLPTGEAISGMQGGTVNTMPASAFQSAGPAASRETSAALQAAAARGDWDAVRGFYQRNGGTWQGRTAEQDAAESQGPRGGVIGGSGRGFNFVRRSEERAADRAQVDRRLSKEEALARDRLDIDRQRAEGEAQTRDFEVRGMQRMERLYQQFEAAETPEARATIAEQIRALSGKDTPNRYTVVPGGQEVTEQGMLRTVPSRVLNNQTGQLVDLGSTARQPAPLPNHIAALKKNPNQAAQFDAIYGEGAAARYLGAN
ncbi:MAG: hypothetical protein GX886_16375 [Comamonadaceae bacterium]|nr:hypothetical protein [Comamonadaceae bacterium]